jgi:hypothetical protein
VHREFCSAITRGCHCRAVLRRRVGCYVSVLADVPEAVSTARSGGERAGRGRLALMPASGDGTDIVHIHGRCEVTLEVRNESHSPENRRRHCLQLCMCAFYAHRIPSALTCVGWTRATSSPHPASTWYNVLFRDSTVLRRVQR